MQELLEGFGLVQLVQDLLLVVLVQVRLVGGGLHALPQPFALLQVEQVHELAPILPQ
ncbi:MAG: hypothetical protein U5K31_12580 [Balneolaceae bacterium]|nr:hypothetical protein [Balneolaceae bacterium]